MTSVKEKNVSVIMNIMLLDSNCDISEPEQFICNYSTDNVINFSESDYFFYKKNGYTDYPKWLKDCNKKVCCEDILEHFSRSISEGLSLIKNLSIGDNNYLFAINFGQGRHNIKKNKVNDTFGIYTAHKIILNNEAKVKHANSRVIEENPINKNRMFGDEIEQDVLLVGLENNEIIRELSISAKNSSNFSSIIGKYGPLNINFKFKESEIPCFTHLDSRLCKLIEIYESISDEEVAGLFKGLQPLPKNKSDELFNQLEEHLNSESSKFYLFEPEIDFDYTRVSGFKYQIYDDSVNADDNYETLDLADYLNLRSTPTYDDIQSDCIILLDEDGNTHKCWSLAECLYGEMVIDNNVYILSHNKWFKIQKDKYEKINSNINSVTDTTFRISDNIKQTTTAQIKAYKETEEYKNATEKKVPKERLFNKSLCDELNGEFFDQLDKQIVIYGDKMEVCDIFLPKTKEFIHSKIGTVASNLSHLFTQGYASGRSFAVMKDSYIPAVNEKIEATENHLPTDHSGYTVRYLIINTARKNELTFISKMALDDKISDLKGFGFDVKLSWVNGIDLNPKTDEDTNNE